MRTNSPRDGWEEVKTGETGLMDEVETELRDDSTSALWGDSGDERFMEQETYPYVGVTSLNILGTEVSQTPVAEWRDGARSLTNGSKDDCKGKTTLLEKDVYDEVTNVRDGLNHLSETTQPAPEETGGTTPTNQPKERLVKEVGFKHQQWFLSPTQVGR